MDTINIIEALKKNEKPFGLMSEEMQAKLRDVYTPINLDIYIETGWAFCGGSDLLSQNIYRLRADYTEPSEDEYELCEILPPNNDGMTWVQFKPDHTLDFCSCEMHENFIGYLYDGDTISSKPTMYHFMSESKGCNVQYFNKTHLPNDIKVLRPTHVVFRKQ